MVKIIKTKERVRDIAEVYTSEREVKAMLNLVKDSSYNIESRFLEPSCGNGNFLIEILDRKLEVVSKRHKSHQDFEFYCLVALASIYGVDICPENVEEAKERMLVHLRDAYHSKMNTRKPSKRFFEVAKIILNTNIIQGDMLNGVESIRFTEYTTPSLYKFKRKVFLLSDLADKTKIKKPISQYRIANFLEIKDVRDTQ